MQAIIVVFTAILSLFFSLNTTYANETINGKYGLSFGDIHAHPAGDTITIEAKAGKCTPTSARGSISENGHSGLIQITSDKSGRIVHILYPETVILTGAGNSITVENISNKSTNGLQTINGTLDIHIGGQLRISPLPVGGSYSGTMNIQILISE